MTVIMGINLSDRICLVADSRVSSRSPVTGEYSTKHDDMLKIENLKQVRGVMIASAGDAELARRVIKAIDQEYSGKTIVEVRAGIEETLRRVGDQYGTVNNKALANFLIAGVDETTPKTINKERFNSIVMGKYAQANLNTRMGGHILEALSKTKEGDILLTLPIANTLLFSAKLDLTTAPSVTDSEWGEILVSGPTEKSTEDAGDEEIVKLEFEHNGNPNPDVQAQAERDSMLSVAIASTMTRKHEWLTVGGVYVPIQLYHTHQAVFLPRKIVSYDPATAETVVISAYTMENGKFYRVMSDGSNRRLKLVSELNSTKAERRENGDELQI